jgi:AcrR family transcriptional regulator
MTGLRARNKADRSRRILECAARLFRDQGFDAARIEDIAAAAGMSPGTVYNHFRTKGDVLLAIVAMEVEEVLAEGEKVLADPPEGVAEALNRLIGGYYRHSLIYLSKAMWRTAMARSIAAPDSAFSRHYTGLDLRLTDQICALVGGLQDRGLLRPDIGTRTLGEMVFDDINQMFIDFVKDEERPMEALLADMDRHHALWARLAQGSAPP